MVCGDLLVRRTGPACGGSADGAPGSVWISWNAQREASDFQLFTGLKDGLRPSPSAPFLPNHYSAFCLWKENSYFYIRPVSFFLCATQSEGSNHSVPTKKNQTNCWTGNKKNGSTLCNSTVLKRQTESSCHTWTASVFTAISDWSENQTHGQSLFSTPHKEHFSSFFNKKREKGLLDVRFN